MLDEDFTRETAVVGWRPDLVGGGTPATLLAFAQSYGPEAEDSPHFHYRTMLTDVVGMVCERAAGQTLQTLLEVRLWQKLGCEQDAHIVVDKVGFPYVGAGMNACARDLARFGMMLLGNGSLNGEEIVPAAWVVESESPCSRTIDSAIANIRTHW
jgi:CubicO group peptidase (beta-lactamase class C family)